MTRTSSHSIKAFRIERVFEAPRDLVFKAWTEPEHFSRWFGPQGTQVQVVRFEARPGGVIHSRLTTDGHEMWGKLIFREVQAPEKLVYVSAFSDEKGGLTRHPFSPDWPREMLTTVTFKDQGGKTLLALEWVPVNATEEEVKTFLGAFDGMKSGWAGSFEQLEAYLASLKGERP